MLWWKLVNTLRRMFLFPSDHRWAPRGRRTDGRTRPQSLGFCLGPAPGPLQNRWQTTCSLRLSFLLCKIREGQFAKYFEQQQWRTSYLGGIAISSSTFSSCAIATIKGRNFSSGCLLDNLLILHPNLNSDTKSSSKLQIIECDFFSLRY